MGDKDIKVQNTQSICNRVTKFQKVFRLPCSFDIDCIPPINLKSLEDAFMLLSQPEHNRNRKGTSKQFL